jgi:SAM-dependent methyltransferase
MTGSDSERERYGLRYDEATHRWMSRRGADSHAGFLTPHLRPGMQLLDCGCGPGSITVGLAGLVAPGATVGVDLAPAQIDRARRLATDARAANAAFAVADAYGLPFASASFDAVFAHATLFHLRAPGRALAEFRRVLRAGGVVGIRDPDYAGWVLAPATPELEAAQRLLLQISRHDGASPAYASSLEALLGEAGFVHVEVRERSAANRPGLAYAERLASPQVRETVVSQGWSDAVTLERLAQALRAWVAAPDAHETLIWREAVGRVGGG